MKQGLLAFQYEQEKGSTGMTGLSGLLTYVELMDAAGLRSSVERHVRLRERGQGWTDSQIIISLMLLNLAGGESVSDLDLLEKDRGLCKILREFETCGMRLSERRALEKRWRVGRRRSVPSESAVFRYLEMFHDAGEEAMREAHRAFIPAPNGAMEGLCKVNADLVGFVQSRSPQTEATLDMDACLVETHKQEALHSYKKYRAYAELVRLAYVVIGAAVVLLAFATYLGRKMKRRAENKVTTSDLILLTDIQTLAKSNSQLLDDAIALRCAQMEQGRRPGE